MDGANNNLPNQPNGGKKGAELKARIITGLILFIAYAAFILLGLFVHPLFYDFFVLALMIFAGIEVSRAIEKKFSKPFTVIVLLTAVLGYAGYQLIHLALGDRKYGITAFFGIVAIMFLVSIVYSIFSKKSNMNNVISTLFVIIYPITIMVYLLSLNYLSESYRNAAILLVFGGSALSDTMAYFVGTTVKGPKLCPSISPHKTISGAIGGLFGGMFGGILILICANSGVMGITYIGGSAVLSAIHFTILGLGTSLFCQLGDIISSYIKRACGIKDFGKILKGHGGFMDRIDGVIIAAVFLYIYFSVLMVVI